MHTGKSFSSTLPRFNDTQNVGRLSSVPPTTHLADSARRRVAPRNHQHHQHSTDTPSPCCNCQFLPSRKHQSCFREIEISYVLPFVLQVHTICYIFIYQPRKKGILPGIILVHQHRPSLLPYSLCLFETPSHSLAKNTHASRKTDHPVWRHVDRSTCSSVAALAGCPPPPPHRFVLFISAPEYDATT